MKAMFVGCADNRDRLDNFKVVGTYSVEVKEAKKVRLL